MSQPQTLLSFVIPVLNEESNVRPCYDTLVRDLQPLASRYDFEFIFTDNHSGDRTFAILHELARHDHRVRVFRFSRNVGYQKSILAGYFRAQGAAVVQVDCDLQDPPAMILEFVQYWEQGYHVVYGIRRARQEGWFIQRMRGGFYWLVDKLSEYPLPQQAGDFRLVARPVIEAVRHMEDSFPYLRGVIAGLGYNQKGIVYDRNARVRGKSNFNWAALFGLAVDGILATSIVPLRVSVYLGLFISAIAALAALGYAVSAIINRSTWPSGFATLAVLLLFSLGLNSMFLGIIGEYIGRLYVQSRHRPLSLVEYSIEQGALRNHAPSPTRGDQELNFPSFGAPPADHKDLPPS